MSVASRLTDLTDALISAINARIAPVGASAYDLYVLNGGTLSQANWLTSLQASSPGDVKTIAGSTAPIGWMLADGSAVSRVTYPALFTAIGTTYGTGDGSTTFNVPDLRGRVPAGYLSGDASFGTLGASGGEKAHTLTQNEMPSHSHTDAGHSHGVSMDNQGTHSHGGGTGSVGDHSHGAYSDTQGYHSHGGATGSVGDHAHGSSTLSGFMTYATTNATRQRFTVGGSTSPYTIGTRASQIDDINYGTTNATGGHNHSIGNDGGHSHNIGTYNAGGHNHSIGNDGGHVHNLSMAAASANISSVGGGASHNNLQPYLTMNFVIKS